MPGRHVDVVALYGSWIAVGLVAALAVPLELLGFGHGTVVQAAMYLLGGAVFGAQGAVLCLSPGAYVGRHMVPPPLELFSLENRTSVYVTGVAALVVGALLLYVGGSTLWLVAWLAA